MFNSIGHKMVVCSCRRCVQHLKCLAVLSAKIAFSEDNIP